MHTATRPRAAPQMVVVMCVCVACTCCETCIRSYQNPDTTKSFCDGQSSESSECNELISRVPETSSAAKQEKTYIYIYREREREYIYIYIQTRAHRIRIYDMHV